ncbi:hypothetical protein [Bacillus sp. FJAT-28004]|uniref:hypothetical protein n=1 Tax=Bacillus sp. FJAT-28004 TaxID=1679165 RepID=UPI000AF667F0|nr:hypothetical protein [Bacillus sp. FJAT-28004]
MRLDEAAAFKRGAHITSLASQLFILVFFEESGGWMCGIVREARVFRVCTAREV